MTRDEVRSIPAGARVRGLVNGPGWKQGDEGTVVGPLRNAGHHCEILDIVWDSKKDKGSYPTNIDWFLDDDDSTFDGPQSPDPRESQVRLPDQGPAQQRPHSGLPGSPGLT